MQYGDEKGNLRHAITVEVVIVNRVYLTRSITHLRRAGSGQSGGIGISGAAAQAEVVKASNDAPAQSSPSSSGVPAEGADAALRKRVAELESQLSQMRTGGVIVRESASGSEILLKEKLDRPVAFGYRSVRHEFDRTENKK